jgi:hypothetical protein
MRYSIFRHPRYVSVVELTHVMTRCARTFCILAGPSLNLFALMRRNITLEGIQVDTTHSGEMSPLFSHFHNVNIFTSKISTARDPRSLRFLITPLPQRAVWGLCIAGMRITGFYGTHQSEVCLTGVSPLSRI